MMRYSTVIDNSMPRLAIDLGYSNMLKSCGIAHCGLKQAFACEFGTAIDYSAQLIQTHGPHLIILEAVLSTYHNAAGNPEIRGQFEKGRGWYHGPGVTTFAAALRFIDELDRRLPAGQQLPLVEGFLSYKTHRTQHQQDAQRLVDEFAQAERFTAASGSQPIHPQILGIPAIRRYNVPNTHN